MSITRARVASVGFFEAGFSAFGGVDAPEANFLFFTTVDDLDGVAVDDADYFAEFELCGIG